MSESDGEHSAEAQGPSDVPQGGGDSGVAEVPSDQPVDPPLPPAAESNLGAAAHVTKSQAERKAQLANTLQGQVAGGGRIESQGDFQAVVVRGHRPNHLLHFLVGVFTLGLWWFVWIGIAIFGGEKRQMISVDEFGNVLVQRV
jgi:hypothetical protein